MTRLKMDKESEYAFSQGVETIQKHKKHAWKALALVAIIQLKQKPQDK